MQISLNKSVRALRGVGVAIFGYGLFTFKLPFGQELSRFPSHPGWLTEENIQTLGWIALLAGTVLFLLSWSGMFLVWVSGIGRKALTRVTIGEDNFELRVMRESDLPSIYPTYKAIFGDDLIAEEIVKGWMAKNPMIAYEVRQIAKKGKAPERIGFFEMLPLTQAGSKKLRSDDPKTSSLEKADIHSGKKWGLAKVYYVASVGVVEPTNLKRAKLRSLAKAMYEGAVMKLLQERLRQLSQRRTIEVLAKPLKDDGLRLVKKNNFTKIQQHLPDREAIWSGTVSLGEIGAERSEA